MTMIHRLLHQQVQHSKSFFSRAGPLDSEAHVWTRDKTAAIITSEIIDYSQQIMFSTGADSFVIFAVVWGGYLISVTCCRLCGSSHDDDAAATAVPFSLTARSTTAEPGAAMSRATAARAPTARNYESAVEGSIPRQQHDTDRQLVGRILKTETIAKKPVCDRSDIEEGDVDARSTVEDGDADTSMVQNEVLADFGDHGIVPVSNDHSACTICLVEYEHGDYVQRNTTCDHIYHQSCIQDWLMTGSSECPCCRTKFAA